MENKRIELQDIDSEIRKLKKEGWTCTSYGYWVAILNKDNNEIILVRK